jgi:hypothetical protein
MNENPIRFLFSHTEGIALVRPVPEVARVDMNRRLRSIWFLMQPSVGLVIGNGSEEGVAQTSRGIISTTPYSAVVDMVAIPNNDRMAHASRLIGLAKTRLTTMLRGEPADKRLNILVAFLDHQDTLDEVARRVMEERNLSIETCNTMHRCLARPGDGVVVNGLGRLTDKPIIPRQPVRMVVKEIIQA